MGTEIFQSNLRPTRSNYCSLQAATVVWPRGYLNAQTFAGEEREKSDPLFEIAFLARVNGRALLQAHSIQNLPLL